jgi:hypothetical protein
MLSARQGRNTRKSQIPGEIEVQCKKGKREGGKKGKEKGVSD